MPLTEQLVDLPIVGGVDEASHPQHCAKLQSMVNCRQFKNGSIGKRYGTVAQYVQNSRFGLATSPPAAELLASLGDELVRVGAGQVDSLKNIASTDCVFKGRASEALVYRRQFTSGETYVVDTDVAYANGYTVLTYRSAKVSSAGVVQTSRISFTVVDADGATVFVDRTLESLVGAAPQVLDPHVVTIGTTAIFVWTNGTAIKGCTLNLTTMALGAVVVLVGGPIAASPSAVCVIGSTLVVAFQDAVGIYTTSFTSALALVVAPALAEAYVAAVTALAIGGLTGVSLYLAYHDINGATTRVRGVVLNPATLAVTVAAFNVDVTTMANTWNVLRLAVTPLAAGTSAIYSWTGALFAGAAITDSITGWLPVTNAGAVGNGGTTKWLSLASKPWFDNGNLYAVVRTIHSTHGTLFVAGLYLSTVTPQVTNGMRLVATIAPRQTPRNAFVYGNGLMSNVIATSTGKYVSSAIVSGSLPDSFVASVLDIRLVANKPVAVESGGLLIMSGGCPSAYDGSTVAELGFAYEPNIANMSATIAAGGNMTASTTYYYLAVYEYRFANGAVVRSIPGYPYGFDGSNFTGLLKVVTTGVNKSATVVLSDITLTNKSFYDPFAEKIYPVSIVLYRTTGDGATFYRLTPLQVTAEYQNWTAYQGATITDTLDDATLQLRPQLYTTSGQLPSEIPPSAAHVAVIQNRVFLSSTDDDTIWFSDIAVDGEAPAFSGSKTLAPFPGGRVVGMAQLDEKYVVLKARSLWFFTGDGPNVAGLEGSFGYPVPIPSDLGCVEPRSIVSTPMGVMFQSQNGLALIGRDLSVSLIGKAIEDTVGTSAVVAASVIPSQELVRFSLSTSKTVEFDMFHGGAWGSNTYGSDPIVGATYCRNAWWFAFDTGEVWKEDAALWTDGGVFVPSSFKTKGIEMSSIQNAQRVWRVGVEGDKKTGHDLTVTVHIDEDAETTQARTWTAAEIAAMSKLQVQQHVVQQKCQGFAVQVSDATPSSGSIGTGQGFVVSAVTAEVGLERGIRRLPATQTK